MYSLSLPFDWGDVLLTPPGSSLHPALRMGLLAAVCLTPLALVLWLYRYELRLVTRLTASALLGLRIAVLVLLLCLTCLQPIYGRTHTEELPGCVLVAVDRSASMDVADPQRPPIDKLRLAKALRLTEGICTEEQLDDWIRHYEQKRPPESLKQKSIHDKLCARIDEWTRTRIAERILSAEGMRLLPALAGKHEVELLGFHREMRQMKTDQLRELFQRPNAEDKAADFTDLRLPLVRALERSTPGQSKVLGIVLLTDGQHNEGEPPTTKARELGERQLPIYPIALGARQPPPDAALVSVRAPNAVFKGVETSVEVTFRISGLPEQDFLLELHKVGKDGKAPIAERTVHHAGKDRTYTEKFPLRMDETGTQALAASLRPVRSDTKETRTDNNNRLTVLHVADDKAKVLLIDGEARWEQHYLSAALKRDRTVQLESVVFQQPRLDDRLSPAQLRAMGLPQQRLPDGPDALADFDCIILGDVSPEHLPAAERSRLEKYVAERGGTLVVLAGKRFMPRAFVEAEAGSEDDPIRKLLPIESPRLVSAPTEGFALTRTLTGKETKFMQMDADPDKNESIWSGLPRHYWGVVGQAKPAASALAYMADLQGGKDPQTEEKESAVVVEQNYGFGKVLFIGIDSTWRWRYRIGDLYHHTFWGAVIRWAASDKPLMAGNEFIRFGTPRPVYPRSEEVKIVARLSEALGPIKTDLLAAARILKEEKAVALVPLSRRSAQPRALEGRVRDLPPGEYAIELVMPDYADKLQAKSGPPGKPLRAHFTIEPPDCKEMIDLQTRWPLLEEIAAKSGGKVFTPENAGELIERLVNQSIAHTERSEQKLWQWWMLLVLVLTLLTIEWAGRKLAGLP